MLYTTTFLLFLIFSSVETNTKIIVVWGVPKGTSPVNQTVNDWNKCITQCLKDVQCVSIEKTSAGCNLYHLGSIKTIIQTDRESGEIVGFKRTMDTCPINNEPPLFDETSVKESFDDNGSKYNYKISKSVKNGVTTWNFGFRNDIQCPDDSFIAPRGKNRACISIQLFPGPNYCQKQADGIKLCQTIGGTGLTGPFSFPEGEIITDNAAIMSEEIPSGINGFQNFWIDGDRTGQTTVEVSDPTLNGTAGYDWDTSLMMVDGSWLCVYLGTSGHVRGKTNAYHCSVGGIGAAFCMRGVVCRTKPVTYY